ncbi:uncharacterized protein LOC6045476 [Culex quinquefasciatus]|uniref:uncharacterized protein LOC6045476 n=1 Tax=Culex quinquefasciatus TaxID=7176 RepID=UPI0018E314F5|nr:uncharacterized protein LOC6045476 [Culex quinquefasciatus]
MSSPSWLGTPKWMQIPYEDKRILSYLVGTLTTIFGTVLYALLVTQKLDDFDDGICASFSYVNNLEIPLLAVVLLVYYVVTGVFLWGVWKESPRLILPFFCLLVATLGFIGHAHIERMLFEVNQDERRLVIGAFVFTTGVLIFASTITLLLYREMHQITERFDKTEYQELSTAEIVDRH